MKLFEVFGEVKLKDKDALKSLGKVDAKGKEVGKSFGSMAKKVGKTGLAFGAMAVAAGGALIGIAKKTGDALDRIDKMSQRLGMTTQAFQEWDFILSQNGVSIDQLQMGMKTLSQRAVEAAEGVGKGSENFQQLGIDVKNVNGELKGQTELFEETIVKLQGMKSGMEKTALAQELFGRSGQELLPLLNSQAGSIEELKKQAEELGIIQSEEAVKAGAKFTDTLDKTTRMIKSLGVEFGTRLLPHLGSLLEWFNQNSEVIKEAVDGVFLALKLIIQGITLAVISLYTFFSVLYDVVKTVIDIFVSIYKVIENSVLTVFENLNNIINNVIVAFKKVQTWFKQNIEDLVEKLSMPFVFAKEKIEAFIEKLKTAIEKFREFLNLDNQDEPVFSKIAASRRNQESSEEMRRSTNLVLDREPTTNANNINVNMDVKDLDELNSWKDFQRRVGELQGAY